jgi:hypothetical protein
MVRNWEQTRLALYQLTSVPPADPLVISLPPIGERSDRSRQTPQHKSIDLEKKLSPDPSRVGCAADPPWLPSPAGVLPRWWRSRMCLFVFARSF